MMTNPTYFTLRSNTLILKCDNIASVIYFLLASHYVFNVDYHTKIKDLMNFIARKVGTLTISKKFQYSPNAGTHATGICRVYESSQLHSSGSDEH